MSSKNVADAEVAKTGMVPDPHNVPVTFANVFAGGGTVNSVVNFTLCVTRFTPTFDKKPDNDIVVAARIRLDMETAKVLRDFLNSQIELLSVPHDKAN